MRCLAKFSLIIMMLVVLSSVTYSTSSLLTGLDSYYTFERSPAVFDLEDVIGTNHSTADSVRGNGVGVKNSSWSFTSTDTITMPPSLLGGRDAFSMFCWANFSSLVSTNVIFVSTDGSATGILPLGASSTVLYRLTTSGGEGGETIGTSTETIRVGEYYLYGIIYNGTHGSGWLNDTQVTSAVKTGTVSVSGGLTFGIGAGGEFNGQLDECGVWNRSLTQLEITGLYNDSVGSFYPDLDIADADADFRSPSPDDGDTNNTQVLINISCNTPANNVTLWFDSNSDPITEVLSAVSNPDDYTTSVGSSNIYYYKASCTAGGINTTVKTWIYDSTDTIITLNPDNGFNTSNETKDLFSTTLILNQTFTDNIDLFAFSINISKVGTEYFSAGNESLSGTTENYYHEIDVSDWGTGNYTVTELLSDSHTDEEIDNYLVATKNKELEFDTTENINIKIVSEDDAETSVIKTKDRYSFSYVWADKETKARVFHVYSDKKIAYRKDSNYKAHFVIWNAETKSGNWVDFGGQDENAIVTKIDDYHYTVSFDSMGDITFNSIGGLNIREYTWIYTRGLVETNIEFTNILDGAVVSGLNLTLSMENGTFINSTINNATTTYYLSEGNYSINTTGTNYANFSTTFTVGNSSIETLSYTLDFIAVFNLLDERTNGFYNISSADSVELLIFCPDETQIVDITNETQSVPINCQYTKFKFKVDYGLVTGNYFRTLILDTDEIFNVSVYLLNLDTTSVIFNQIRLDDLLNVYDNPSIYIKKIIGANTVIITSDFVDVEDSISAYLIENNEYSIEIQSDNQPTRIMGAYSADIAGEKVLQLWDVQITPTEAGEVYFITGVVNNSPLRAYLSYDDSSGLTDSVAWSLWENGDTEIYSTSSTLNSFALTYELGDAYSESNITSKIVVNRLGEITTKYINILEGLPKIILGISEYLDTDTFNWAITIIISVIALFASIRTANMTSLIICGLASLLMYWGLFTITWGVLGLATLIAVISLLKEKDRDSDLVNI